MTGKTIPNKVKLQINATGAWRDVLRFCTHDVDTDLVQQAAANMVLHADSSGKTTLRLATDDGRQTALIRWDMKKGWVEA
ncbi:MAG: hypothetical protein WC829_15710 [Hyphomicrobium sp.]|jgi:hypothetical protein